MARENPDEQIEETVKYLVNAINISKSDRSESYGLLLSYLDQRAPFNCDSSNSALQTLRLHLPSLLPFILQDISSEDEELASQALKFLGYVLYHPLLVADLSDDNVKIILQSLEKIITTTEIKAVCNLATWCISVQQIRSNLISANINTIVRAVAHALDNPMGSKSITFESTQATIKLGTQAMTDMRHLSHVWCPPILRRLLSRDKKERDMAYRCLEKVKSSFLPPNPLLSKIVGKAVKHELLLKMENLLQENDSKISVTKAWSWIIRCLGGFNGSSGKLVNPMLKMLEKTFADVDPQVCISSLIAWRAMADVLLENSSSITAKKSVSLTPEAISPLTVSPKHLKLLMTPLIGTMTDGCNVAVKLSCWKTWNYVLSKLGYVINDPAVISVVIEPMLKVIFENGSDRYIWDQALDFLEKFVSESLVRKQDDKRMIAEEYSSPTIRCVDLSKDNECDLQISPLKCLSWNLIQLDFLLRSAGILWRSGFRSNKSQDFRNLTWNGALRIFRAILTGIHSQLKKQEEISEEEVGSIHAILQFVDGLLADTRNEISHDKVNVQSTSIFNLIEVIIDELQTSILFSSSCKLHLDFSQLLKCRRQRISDSNDSEKNMQIIETLAVKADMVVPAIYLIVMWIDFAADLSSDACEEADLLEKLAKISKIILSCDNPIENCQDILKILHAFVNIGTKVDQIKQKKFKNSIFFWLKVWKVFATILKEHIEYGIDAALAEITSTDTLCQMIYNFLLFPAQALVSYSSSEVDKSCCGQDYRDHFNFTAENDFKQIIEEWTLLYDAARRFLMLKGIHENIFAEGFCKMVLRIDKGNLQQEVVDGKGTSFLMSVDSQFILELIGEFIVHILKQTDPDSVSMVAMNHQKRFKSPENSLISKCTTKTKRAAEKSERNYMLTLTVRFLTRTLMKADSVSVVSRIFDAIACFLGQITLQDNVLAFLKVFSHPLTEWLGACSNNESAFSTVPVFQFERVWSQLLNCLQRCQPKLAFDSEFLSLQAPLLLAAFQHTNTSIANATIAFWEATYGKSSCISYPESLVPVLRSLSKKANITLPGMKTETGDQILLEHPSNSKSTDTLELVNIIFGDVSNNVHTHPANFRAANQVTFDSNVPRESHVECNVNDKDKPTYHTDSKIGCHSVNVGPGKTFMKSFEGETAAHTLKSSIAKSTASPLKRRKVNFMDDSQDIEYVVIPSPSPGEKKLCPMTDHQREVKRAQQGRGMDTVEHGPVIKTYTSADFSQGNGDSQDLEELIR